MKSRNWDDDEVSDLLRGFFAFLANWDDLSADRSRPRVDGPVVGLCQVGAGSAGIQGWPVSASRRAVILSRPCLAAVNR
jgi:hypothetical protein